LVMLSLDRVVAGYGSVVVLEGLSLEVREGETVSLLGANASGKSTTLKTILGYVRPTEGRITFQGCRIDGLSTEEIVRLGITMVPENRRVFPEITVRENLLIGAYLRNDRRRVSDDLRRMLELFPVLRTKLETRAGALSGGEQQMLAIARALMSNPRLILMDEPSMGLAPAYVRLVYDTIKTIQKKGICMLIVEQNVNMALNTTDRAYVLQKGKIALSGASLSLLQNEDVCKYYLGKMAGLRT